MDVRLSNLMMKIHGKGGLLDFSKDKLTERNKENSFLDVDWIIEELINYGHEKMANDVPKSPNNTIQRSASIKTKFKKKVTLIVLTLKCLCLDLVFE